MDAKDLSCWKCGASLEDIPLPIGRLAECLACRAELHVCRLCEFYDPLVAQACREPMAEEVKDKTRANFCEHFYPQPGTHSPVRTTDEAPSSELAALFGDAPADEGSAPADETEGPSDPEQAARDRLDDLFR
jgi:hypothetical protein